MSAGNPPGTARTGLRVHVDRELCCGAGNCVRTAPEVFEQDEVEGLVLLRTPAPPPGTDERVALAADLCPAGAIRGD